ncbi:MAG: class I SAM-dependent methyltransferase [Pseudomonadota bacterium]
MTSSNSEQLTPTVRVDAYDAAAWLYDWVVGSWLYHRLVWGMAPAEHGRFAEHALSQTASGSVLDAGSGSLLFTAHAYRAAERQITLFDASSGMLARARQRLGAQAESARFRFQRGDLYRLPFRTAEYPVIFHFGVLHCLSAPSQALAELARVTEPGGKLFLICLVLGRPRGDAFLRRLARAGHVAPPRTASAVLEMVENAGFSLTARATRGSFLFLEAMKPGG